VVLFALGIAVSIALHEAGHMWTAKAFGMRVRRYYHRVRPEGLLLPPRRDRVRAQGDPRGGFCDIAGMTALDEVTPEEAPRAFFRKPTGSASSCCPPARSRTSSSGWCWSTRWPSRRACRTCATPRSSAS
jgi:membrane-associated protease RseP (regulator of RpoE activity)